MSQRTAPSHMPPPRPNKAKSPPQNKVLAFFWRRWVWVEGTFVFSMLEIWETTLLLTLFAFFLILLGVAVKQYLPQHLALMSKRAVYYIWGSEDGEDRLLKQWLGQSHGSKVEL